MSPQDFSSFLHPFMDLPVYTCSLKKSSSLSYKHTTTFTPSSPVYLLILCLTSKETGLPLPKTSSPTGTYRPVFYVGTIVLSSVSYDRIYVHHPIYVSTFKHLHEKTTEEKRVLLSFLPVVPFQSLPFI